MDLFHIHSYALSFLIGSPQDCCRQEKGRWEGRREEQRVGERGREIEEREAMDVPMAVPGPKREAVRSKSGRGVVSMEV